MSDLQTLFAQLHAFEVAPVDKWHPPKTIDIDILIATNGAWFYQGSPIQRQRMVKLFSSVLRLEDDQYFLVTPPIKYRIQVNDVPFMAMEMNQVQNNDKGNGTENDTENNGQKLYFRTNMDEVVLADHSHPLTVITNPKTAESVPYIMVRSGLKAKITRAVFYQLAELLQPAPVQSDVANTVGVFSAGTFFPFGTVLA